MIPATTLPATTTFRGGDYVASLMAELNRAAICTRIKLAQKQSGLTQAELADLMHVHINTVQNWSSAKTAIVPWDRLDEIARSTSVSKDWLLHGEDQPATPHGLSEELQQVRELVEEILDRLPGREGGQGRATGP